MANIIYFLGLQPIKNAHLQAHAADAITNGFSSVYGCLTHRCEPHPIDIITKKRPKCPNFKRAMCFFNVAQAIKPQIEKIPEKSIQESLHLDIREIQRAQSERIFNKAIDSFYKKYTKMGSRVGEFLEYFDMQWVQAHPG